MDGGSERMGGWRYHIHTVHMAWWHCRWRPVATVNVVYDNYPLRGIGGGLGEHDKVIERNDQVHFPCSGRETPPGQNSN